MTTPAPITAASTLTPISGGASYCTPTQFFTWFDLRSCADYLSDTNTPIGAVPNTNPVQINAAVVATNQTLINILQAASGKLEGAVMVGGRYAPGDLILLTQGPMASSNMAAWIAQIVAGIAAPALIRRRPNLAAPKMDIIEESEKVLAALADNQNIFGLQEVMDAGVLSDDIEQLEDVRNRAMTTWRARRMFGSRTKWHDTPVDR